MLKRIAHIAVAAALVSSPAFAAKIPQLDPTWFPSQLFWLAVTFFALLLIVGVNITPKVRRVLDDRDNAIQGALKEAESYKSSAEAAKSNFEQAGSEARNKAATLIADAQASINGAAAEEQTKLDAVLSGKLAEADAATKQAKAKALDAVAAPAASLVQTMAGKLLGADVSASDAENAVKKVA